MSSKNDLKIKVFLKKFQVVEMQVYSLFFVKDIFIGTNSPFV